MGLKNVLHRIFLIKQKETRTQHTKHKKTKTNKDRTKLKTHSSSTNTPLTSPIFHNVSRKNQIKKGNKIGTALLLKFTLEDIKLQTKEKKKYTTITL